MTFDLRVLVFAALSATLLNDYQMNFSRCKMFRNDHSW